ncbi:MAG: M20 family metallopeptidase [Thermocladium sp.]|jgi:succinyl-diaminopimelate desuccinylase|nr:MAG: succinyl-diaminopimelate desuccinylase [Thermocladium sp. ECH_B]
MSNIEDELTGLTIDLVRINSVNPPGLTNDIASFIREWLGRRGYQGHVYEYEKGKPNIIAKVGRGSPTLILNGHMDVVPPGESSKWSVPPFSGKVIDGKIFGRGTTDMKGGLAALMMAFIDLAPQVENSDASLIFSATVDEESGGHPGVEALVNNGVLRGDAAIIAEPTGASRFCIAEKGLAQVRINTMGRPAHGSLPILGRNAILELINAVNESAKAINEFNRGIKLPRDLEAPIENSAKIYGAAARGIGLRVDDNELGNIIGSVSFNPGVIRGGSKINMVPDSAELELDMRVPPGASSRQVIDYLAARLGDSARVEVIDVSEPNYTPINSEIVASVRDSIIEEGKQPVPLILTGATDGRYLRAAGIPVVIYGPGELAMAHSYDEYVAIDDLKDSLIVMEKAIQRFLGLGRYGKKIGNKRN